MTTLTNEQMRHYEEQGYVLVSGLVPEPVAQEAAAALWRLLDADPARLDTWAAISGAHQTYPGVAGLLHARPARRRR